MKSKFLEKYYAIIKEADEAVETGSKEIPGRITKVQFDKATFDPEHLDVSDELQMLSKGRDMGVSELVGTLRGLIGKYFKDGGDEKKNKNDSTSTNGNNKSSSVKLANNDNNIVISV